MYNHNYAIDPMPAKDYPIRLCVLNAGKQVYIGVSRYHLDLRLSVVYIMCIGL